MTIIQALDNFVESMRRHNSYGFVTAGIGKNETIIAYFEPDKMPDVEVWFVDDFKVIPKPMGKIET
jgi:hypothetical protein